MTRYLFLRNGRSRLRCDPRPRPQRQRKSGKPVRPGVRFCDLDKAARDVISEAGYGEYFTHRLGHSIGMQAHEAGDVSQGNPAEVQEGMTFSIEPGVYLPANLVFV